MAASVSPSLVKANAVDETGKPLTGTSKARYDKMKVLTADISRLEKNALLLGSNYADAIHFCKTKANDYITKFELDFESIDKTGKTKDEKDALITAENEAVESFRGFSSIIEKKISIQYMNTADFAADKVADDVKNILSTLKYFENGTTTQGTSNNLPDLSIALEKAIQSFISTNANQNQISKSNEHLQNKLVYIDEYPEFEFISDPHSNIADLVETRNLVNSLSPLEKNIVILKVFFDLSDLEISKKYNFSRQYIQKTKDRAYQKLREQYA